ncbi:MAG TPA: hypothetical protein DCQ31_01895 [Bacteroidales bacterium]|nr:hypothetical protein [Bacteroidales bacterium]
MYKKIKLSVLALSLVFSSLYAQHYTSSPYSYYGLGEISNALSGQSTGMGYTSAASSNAGNINFFNPASYQGLSIQSFLFDVSISSKQSIYKQNNQSFSVNNTNLQYIAAGFKGTNFWAASFGVMPYSSMGYDISISDTVGTTDKYERYLGEGGLNKVYFGNSFRIHKSLWVGINASYYFGSLEKRFTRNVSDSAYSTLVRYETNTKISGYRIDYGFQSNFSLGTTKITIGGVYESTAKLKGYRTEDGFVTFSNNGITNSEVFVAETGRENKKTTDIPQKIAAGLSLNFNDKITVTGDYSLQNWSNALFLGETSVNYSQYSKISAGLEYIPKITSYKYREIIRYRLGAYTSNGYITLPDKNNAMVQPVSFGVTAGIGLPMKASFGGMNLSFEAGKTNVGAQGLSETYFMFHANLSLRDIWFIKRKYN